MLIAAIFTEFRWFKVPGNILKKELAWNHHEENVPVQVTANVLGYQTG